MTRLLIPSTIRAAVEQHARRELPQECCGLLVGVGHVVSTAIPLVNELCSPTRFRSEPRSMLDAMKQLRRSGEEVLAIYHSHPTSPATPSRHDLADHNWPGAAMVIVSLAEPAAAWRAWQLDGESTREIAIQDPEVSGHAVNPL